MRGPPRNPGLTSHTQLTDHKRPTVIMKAFNRFPTTLRAPIRDLMSFTLVNYAITPKHSTQTTTVINTIDDRKNYILNRVKQAVWTYSSQ